MLEDKKVLDMWVQYRTHFFKTFQVLVNQSIHYIKYSLIKDGVYSVNICDIKYKVPHFACDKNNRIKYIYPVYYYNIVANYIWEYFLLIQSILLNFLFSARIIAFGTTVWCARRNHAAAAPRRLDKVI